MTGSEDKLPIYSQTAISNRYLASKDGKISIGHANRIILGLYIFMEVFSGPLKVFFLSAGLDAFYYLPKALSLLLIFYCVFVLNHTSRFFLFLFFLLLISTARTFGVYQSLFQSLLGFWVIIPFIFGALSYRQFSDPRLIRVCKTFLALAVFGVFLSGVVRFPWQGVSIEVGGVNLQAVRDWTAVGVRRLPGFSLISGQVADQLLVLGAIVFYFEKSRMRVIVAIFVIIALYLTTMKTHLGAFIIFTLLVAVNTRSLTNIFIITFGVLVQLLPIFSYIRYITLRGVEYGDELVIGFLTLGSFFQRMAFMWPKGMEYIIDRGGLLFGTGVGGIGPALARNPNEDIIIYGNFTIAPADGMFVYLFAMFGIFAILFITGTMIATLRSRNEFARNVIVSCLTLGVGQTVVSGTMTALFFGSALSFVFLRARG